MREAGFEGRSKSLFPAAGRVVGVGLICLFFSSLACGTELKPVTVEAFQRYAEHTEARIQREVRDPKHFLDVDSLGDPEKSAVLSHLRNGDIVIRPMTTRDSKGPIEIPGGLVHHWMATAFVPGATADQVLKLAKDYSRYGELYQPDVQYAKILSHNGEHFHVYYRLCRHTIVSVVYNSEFDVVFVAPENWRNYSASRATRIAEVVNPGKPGEREYAVGKDHGYLWRLNLYTRCLERDGGVYIQVEFVALSRSVPPILAWLVSPYLRSIPREYLRRYLEATRGALLRQEVPESRSQLR